MARAEAGPTPLRDAEPLPLVRAPELARRPVELVPRALASLGTCASGTGNTRCQALGPAVEGELLALYRPTPYFAFGGALSYGRRAGSLPNGALAAETLSLALAGRVYLLEEGVLDPYLEALVGWGSERTTLVASSAEAASTTRTGAKEEDLAFGPFGRAGGGVDWFVAPSVKVGLVAAFSQLVLARGETCRAGSCAAGAAAGGAARGGLSAGLGLSVLLGQGL